MSILQQLNRIKESKYCIRENLAKMGVGQALEYDLTFSPSGNYQTCDNTNKEYVVAKGADAGFIAWVDASKMDYIESQVYAGYKPQYLILKAAFTPMSSYEDEGITVAVTQPEGGVNEAMSLKALRYGYPIKITRYNDICIDISAAAPPENFGFTFQAYVAYANGEVSVKADDKLDCLSMSSVLLAEECTNINHEDDATATEEHILSGYTAYARGQLLTGKMKDIGKEYSQGNPYRMTLHCDIEGNVEKIHSANGTMSSNKFMPNGYYSGWFTHVDQSKMLAELTSI